MTQSTDTDIKDLKTAIESIARTTEANAKAIADLTLEIRVGFANVDAKFAVLREEMKLGFANTDKKIDILDTRLAEVEKKIDKQDTRLWAFGGIVLTAALGGLWKLLG
jgi:hypothetical protein